jgi:N-methylhydantoinase A
VHAYRIARILRCARVVYPLAAGVMSAIGFLCAPLAFDFVRSVPGRLETMDWGGQCGARGDGAGHRGCAGPGETDHVRRFGDLCYGVRVRDPGAAARGVLSS